MFETPNKLYRIFFKNIPTTGIEPVPPAAMASIITTRPYGIHIYVRFNVILYSHNFFPKEKIIRDGESNHGLPRDRREYFPLYYLGCQNIL